MEQAIFKSLVRERDISLCSGSTMYLRNTQQALCLSILAVVLSLSKGKWIHF